MGFFDFFKQSNINQGIEEYKRTAGAVLLDVRTPQEYQEGHIPESKNVPLQQLDNIVSVAKNKDIHSVCILLFRFSEPSGNWDVATNGIF